MTPSAYLRHASPRYRQAFNELEGKINENFPHAKKVLEWGMPGWKMPLPEGRQAKEHRGTYDPTCIFIFLADRKAGITLHLWSPLEPQILSRFDRQLTKAGFKVMVGCVQYNRKGEYPVSALKQLLESLASGLK